MMQDKFRLVIWDCDGCLVDSEYLFCCVAAQGFTEAGFALTPQQFVDKYAGCSWKTIKELARSEAGDRFLEGFSWEKVTQKAGELFEKELRPISYVGQAIEEIGLPVCVASGSEQSRISQSLRITDLERYFGAHVFSAHHVARGKPAPDIFLYAAQQMGVDPSHCLVIEDSPYGVEAARAAGMTVFGFVGGSHISQNWRNRISKADLAVVFDDMRELPALVKNYTP